MKPTKKYYAYSVPKTKKHGVTDNWETCKKIVSGLASARYKGFKTKKKPKIGSNMAPIIYLKKSFIKEFILTRAPDGAMAWK